MASQITIDTGSEAWITDSAIDSAALGAEFLGWEQMHGFTVRHDDVGFTHLRWPGAIPAEDGIDITGDGVRDVVFDLTFENIVDWRRWADNDDKLDGTPEGVQREGLTEMLAHATQNDMSFAMIVPTARYVEEALAAGDTAAALDHARADIRQFVERLAAGEFGAVPADFTLEIGTEYYATDVWVNNNADPTDNRDGTTTTTDADLARLFGEVFAVMADEVTDTLADLDASGANPQNIDLKVAVQTGRFQSAPDTGQMDGQPADDAVFIEAFRDHDALDDIDSLIWHRYVPEFDQIDMGVTEPIHGTTLAEIIGGWEDATGQPLDLVGGWMAPTPQNDVDAEFGAPSLTSILQGFATLADAGMDTGTIYGLGFNQSGSLGDGTTTFIGGQLYQMMVESLPGTYLLDGYQNNTTPAVGEVLVQDDSVNSYTFEDDSKVVVFLAAKDFSGSQLDYEIALDGLYSHAETTHLIDPDGIDTITTSHIGVVGEMWTETDVPVAQVDGSSTVSLSFTTDYEVIRLTLHKDDTADGDSGDTGGTAPEIIHGTDGDDDVYFAEGDITYQGGAGDDTIAGGTGDMHLIGGAGSDRLTLEQGNGILEGWNGDDVLTLIYGNGWLYGNDGHDTLQVREGDVTMMGGAGNDTLSLSRGDGWLDGGDGDDSLSVNKGDATLLGGAGDDVLSLIKGKGVLDGGAGDDILTGGQLADEFVFGAGHDTITDFDPLEDRLTLDPALWGGSIEAADLLQLMSLQDGHLVIGFTPEDSLTLQGIDDPAVLSDAAFGLDEGALAAALAEIDWGHDVLADGDSGDSGTEPEILYGTDGDDDVYFAEGDITYQGGAGDDTIAGGTGDMHLIGGAGNDRVTLEQGNGVLEGGGGNDVLTLIFGNGWLYGGDGHDTLQVREGDATMIGGAGDDILSLSRGDGMLDGGDGDDILSVNKGDATLLGGAGDDVLSLIKGKGVLDGGAGDDILTGGQLADEFIFGAGHDMISDFDPLEDRLTLDPALWGGGAGSLDDLLGRVTVRTEGLHLDFGADDSLMLLGLNDPALLTAEHFAL